MEAFCSYLKLSFLMSLMISFPFVVWQIYSFIAPGLYKFEKRSILPFIILSPILFVIGGAVAYYGAIPLAWRFFLSFENNAIVLEAKLNEYLDLVMDFFIGFGLAFQMPILISLLSKIGIINTNHLRKFRRYAIVVIFILAAILTPPDVISQIMLAIPMLFLYEISILFCRRKT